MKKPHFFKKIYLSITSDKFYLSVLQEHFMKAFAYLILLTVMISIPISIYSSFSTMKDMDKLAEIVESVDFPSFELSYGNLTFHDDQIFVYSSKPAKMFTFIIDPTDTYTFNDLAGYDLGFLVTENNIILSQAGQKPLNVEHNPFISMSNQRLADLLHDFKPYMPLITILMLGGLGIVLVLFLSIFIALSTHLFALSFHMPLSLSQAYKLAIYSMTTPLLVAMVIQLLPFQLLMDYTVLIILLINGFYLIRVLKFIKGSKDITVAKK